MATRNGTGRTRVHLQQPVGGSDPAGGSSSLNAGLPWLAGEITSIADEALAVWHEMADCEADGLQAVGSTIARMIERVGWLADTMTATLGGTPLRGAEAADWSMPEGVRQALGSEKLRQTAPIEPAEHGQPAGLAPERATMKELYSLVGEANCRVRSAASILAESSDDLSSSAFGALYLLQDVVPKLDEATSTAGRMISAAAEVRS